jgi:hypothetical protein
MLGNAGRMPERECCAVDVASFVENQSTRQFTIVPWGRETCGLCDIANRWMSA